MKAVPILVMTLTGVLAQTCDLRADDSLALAGNPYAAAAARNMFGLNPPAPPSSTTAADQTPPPKITPNGIMSIFGQLQVLFKTADKTKGGKPGAEQDYILSEGERQDDIEVVKIDEKGGIVTFKNHGEIQNLTLAAGTASSSAGAAAATVATPANPGAGFHPATGGFSSTAGNNFAMRGNGPNTEGYGRQPSPGNNGMTGNNYGGGASSYGANNTAGGINFGGANPNQITTPGYHETGPPMAPEVQAAIMEAQRLQMQNAGDEAYKLLPPTEVTPPGGSLWSSPNQQPNQQQ